MRSDSCLGSLNLRVIHSFLLSSLAFQEIDSRCYTRRQVEPHLLDFAFVLDPLAKRKKANQCTGTARLRTGRQAVDVDVESRSQIRYPIVILMTMTASVPVLVATLIVALKLTVGLAFSPATRGRYFHGALLSSGYRVPTTVPATTATTAGSQHASSNSALHMALKFMTHYEEVQLNTDHGMSVFDITPQIEAIVDSSGCQEGTVTILSKHSTVSVSINEMEGRLVDDIRQSFLKLVPPNLPWLHNDIDYRVGPKDWPGGDEAWRDFRRTQPGNTHSHLIAMMLGTSETIPISGGDMKKGKYQSILVVDVDGPKPRGIAVQITGGK
jgi:thiamine phosphate synthase YjbQ (UPF0047 family)